MTQAAYLSLLSRARRLSGTSAEAEDLLHAVLLSAVEKGRADLGQPQNRRWLLGALTKRAAFEARTAVRRRTREAAFQVEESPPAPTSASAFIDSLPPSLRGTALLALTGHTRAEIAYLLRISNPALRQRITQLRKRWQEAAPGSDTPALALRGPLPFGRLRHALRHGLRHIPAPLATHDPDGHLFVMAGAHKMPRRGNL